VRLLLLALALLAAAPAAAEEFSRAEVEQLLGPPTDEFQPAPPLGPPLRAGTTALVYVTAGKVLFPKVGNHVAPPGRWLLVVVLSPEGQLVEARTTLLDEDGPTYDVTNQVKKFMREKRD
jgi:hypothetical protein